MRFVCIILLVTAIFISCSKSTTQQGSNNSIKGLRVYSDVVYGSNQNYYGVQQSLDLDVYVPESAINSGAKLPLLLFVHGGGFIKGSKNSDNDFIEKMAKKGFVVSSINYRLGRDFSETNPCDADTTELKEAVYRAVQDCNASLRFLAFHAGDYNIDTTWIFTSGRSAGCVTILTSHYNTQASLQASGSDFSDKLGTLYDADNNIQTAYTIKGMVPQWGDVNDINLITSATGVPSIFFHGAQDAAAPYNKGTVYFCQGYPFVYGSKAMYDKLHALNISSVLHVDPDGGHGVFNDDFIADNTACFLKSIMQKQQEDGIYSGYKTSCTP